MSDRSQSGLTVSWLPHHPFVQMNNLIKPPEPQFTIQQQSESNVKLCHTNNVCGRSSSRPYLNANESSDAAAEARCFLSH